MRRDDTRLLRSEEMQELDRRTQELFGIPGAILMENAGQKAWALLRKRLAGDDAGERPQTSRPILFVAGNGNNGGDVLVMARQCIVEGEHTPTIVTVKDRLSGAASEQWRIIETLGVPRTIWERDREAVRRAIDRCDCIIDGITGTGLSGPLRPLEAELIAELNATQAYRVAVDIPSGMRDGGGPDETFFHSDLTISTGHRKRLLFAPARRHGAGEIVRVDPGFPDIPLTALDSYRGGETTLVEPPFPTIPVKRDAHKGTRGRVSIIAGGEGTEGAAILASLGAVSAGAGMVRTWTTPEGCAAGLGREPAVMWRDRFPGESEFDWADAIVCGPGWTGGTAGELRTMLAAAAERRTPVVLDAAALHLVSTLVDEGYRGEPGLVVLTPHPGELAMLAGRSVDDVRARPFELLDEAAERTRPLGRVEILLKSSVSILRDHQGRFAVVDGRCPVLGTAGSGDVLSGIIGACLVAADRSPEDAVLAAVGEHLLRGRGLEARHPFVSATTIATTPSTSFAESAETMPGAPFR